ncbi:MAG: RNA methyltransferase [Rickettsiales bacterium]|nr:RNA methyltransferase [Rickettsiales bacterium]
MPTPVVILVRPQMGENIGAVARAMSNFGLSELRLVAPRDGWPNSKAWEMASGGKPIVEKAQVFPDFIAATQDVQLAFATTARPRDMEKTTLNPSEAMRQAYQASSQGKRIALVFGPERTGLENEEITWCDAIVTIPTAPENFSLNLGQSAVILGYEWWKQQETTQALPAPELATPATKGDWDGFFTQLEQYLDESGFFRVADKKAVMWQNLRTALLRTHFSEQELRSLRGVFRVLWEGRRPRK